MTNESCLQVTFRTPEHLNDECRRHVLYFNFSHRRVWGLCLHDCHRQLAATAETVTRYLTMNSMLAASPSPSRFSKVSHPPLSSPLSPNFGSFSPIPRTPSRHRQYKNRDFSSPTPTQENPRKAFLREQFKKRCFERAQKARQDQVRNRRRSSCALSSDGFDYDDDAEMEESEDQDAEDDVLNDEVCV